MKIACRFREKDVSGGFARRNEKVVAVAR